MTPASGANTLKLFWSKFTNSSLQAGPYKNGVKSVQLQNIVAY
jgi:hypothetical protein